MKVCVCAWPTCTSLIQDFDGFAAVILSGTATHVQVHLPPPNPRLKVTGPITLMFLFENINCNVYYLT